MNAHPTVVLFDAVGTVIKPVPGVIEIYEQLGQAHGSQLATEEIKDRIQLARQKHFHLGATVPVSDKIDFRSSDQIERQLWKRLVLDVFDDLPTAEALFDELWTHFDQHQNWQLYNDVDPCWKAIRERGWMIGLASNFDSRLLSISKKIPTLNSADFVFHSAGVGFRKPSPDFYRVVENSIRNQVGEVTILMTGDDLENDCLAPSNAGWKTQWLNRKGENVEPTVPSSHSQQKAVSQIKTLTEFCERAIQ